MTKNFNREIYTEEISGPNNTSSVTNSIYLTIIAFVLISGIILLNIVISYISGTRVAEKRQRKVKLVDVTG